MSLACFCVRSIRTTVMLAPFDHHSHVYSRLGGIQLAVLHPRQLVLYSMASVGASQAAAYLEVRKLWEHQLERSAACMVCGKFGSSRGTQQQTVHPHPADLHAGVGGGQSFAYAYRLLMPYSAEIRTDWRTATLM